MKLTPFILLIKSLKITSYRLHFLYPLAAPVNPMRASMEKQSNLLRILSPYIINFLSNVRSLCGAVKSLNVFQLAT